MFFLEYKLQFVALWLNEIIVPRRDIQMKLEFAL